MNLITRIKSLTDTTPGVPGGTAGLGASPSAGAAENYQAARARIWRVGPLHGLSDAALSLELVRYVRSAPRPWRLCGQLGWVALGVLASLSAAQPTALDASLRDRIDLFVKSEPRANGAGQVEADAPVARGLATVSLNRPLGERFEYSNLNFVMLGAVLEAVTGQTWQAQVQARLLASAAPLRRFKLGAEDLTFRSGDGWLVGPFGAASDARWHQGALASFEAWMVLLPGTKQAVVVLINAKSDLPFNGLDTVTSRLPLGVVNLLRGQPPPAGPSLQEAYLPFNAACAVSMVTLIALCGWAVRTRCGAWSLLLLCLPVALRTGAWARRSFAGTRQ